MCNTRRGDVPGPGRHAREGRARSSGGAARGRGRFHRKVTGTPDFLVPVGRPAPVGPEGGRPAALFRRGPATSRRPAMLRPGRA
ncbi:MAG: hypothetical protein KY451_15330 [Actinobacteria bacterium]|nr:hypothetical protein [Actinomycetota bacterium]